ncbi:glycoside hydrolase family 27 protein [Niabella aurantiaca]|uniref:glycoside hydrolase family 27 protein n=1 Tax=Niabella aurantiaca TaxID=379900 RepID=UPI0003672A11|nr:glycoside hydrolase family 27 protein [Niabella aurantiaca]
MKKYRTRPLLLGLLLTAAIQGSAQVRPELAPHPPMGWNSWNYFGKEGINEKIVYEVIDAMVTNGLRDAGYQYVIIDGGWRDEKLDKDGRLRPHPVRFPNGIKPLADYAHAKGLKLGLHTVPGTHDCGGNPVGGYGKEALQVKQFADWGIDFIKLDLCRMKEDPCKQCAIGRTGWSEPTIKTVYSKWSRLLHQCGRDIVFSISAYQFRPWNPALGNMSRTTRDILSKRNPSGAVFNDASRDNSKSFLSVMACAEINNASAKYAGNGYWNDPDMLVTGNQGLTAGEEQAHFALWAIMNAPLMLGNDPRNMDPREKTLLLNKELIAVDQDRAGQGRLMIKKPGYQVWKKEMEDGSAVLLLLNLDTKAQHQITVRLRKLGIKGNTAARDVIAQEDLGLFRKKWSARLAPHTCRLIRFEKTGKR